MNKQIYEALIESITDEVTLLANTSAYLNELMDDINWVGFYLLKNDQLVLGPFQGKVACITIALDKGVCGHVARTRQPILVPDVHQFDGHIACDAASNSEMVLPIFHNDQLYGVLDIDSPLFFRFNQEDLAMATEIIDSFQQHLVKIKAPKRL